MNAVWRGHGQFHWKNEGEEMTKIGSLVGILLLALYAPLAQASLQISYQVGASAPVVCASGTSAGSVVCNATIGDLVISNLTGVSNSPGSALIAKEFGAGGEISSTAAYTLQLWITAQDFTAPLAPPTLIFVSSVVETGATGTWTIDMTSCINTANALNPSSCFASLTNTTVTYSGIDSNQNTVTSLLSSLSGPYSLSEHITVVLGAGSDVNIATSTLLTPVPEASSILLLGVFGVVGLLLRRRIFTA